MPSSTARAAAADRSTSTSSVASGGPRRRPSTDADARDFDEVWIFDNPDGHTTERWFHAFGCRRWLTVRRDTS